MNLDDLTLDELKRRHWERERHHARQILTAPKRSQERAAAIRNGYSEIAEISGRIKFLQGRAGSSYGYAPRHADLIRRVVRAQAGKKRGRLRFFELGFGQGHALMLAASEGCRVAGLEVVPEMYKQAVGKLPAESIDELLLGSFLDQDLQHFEKSVDVFYSNDVVEHIAPDELPEYLSAIYRLLRPGGVLLTVTPNWHTRPADITREFRPPRTEAEGFHLKEYQLRELAVLYRSAGFSKVLTPLVATRTRAFLLGRGGVRPKLLFEPLLEQIPFRLSRLLVSGLAMNCTIAVR